MTTHSRVNDCDLPVPVLTVNDDDIQKNENTDEIICDVLCDVMEVHHDDIHENEIIEDANCRNNDNDGDDLSLSDVYQQDEQLELLDFINANHLLGDGSEDAAPNAAITLVPAGVKHPDLTLMYPGINGVGAIKSKVFMKINPIWSLWVQFCDATQRPLYTTPPTGHGLGLYILRNGIAIPVVNLDLIGEFFEWIEINIRACTPNTMSTMKTFLNHHLKLEATLWRTVDDLPVFPPVKTFVGSIEAVKLRCDLVRARQADLFRDSGQDYQADLDRVIENDELITVFLAALKTCPQNSPINRIKNPLGRLQFGATLAKLFQIMRRGEELRYQTLGMRFLRLMPTIGPGAGTLCPHAITNKAKHNAVNRLEYTCWTSHVNPLFDSSAWDGLCFLYRFCIGGEPWPDFLDWTDFAQRFSYVSMTNYKHCLSSDVMYKQWKLHFQACSIVCDKVCHQPRRQSQQRLDARSVPLPAIQRACGYKSHGAGGDAQGQQLNKDQTRSYLTSPPVGVVVECAGGSYAYTKAHNPLWASRSVRTNGILQRLCNIAIPRLLETQATVHNAFSLCKSHEECKERRLYMAKGAVDEMIFSIEQAFLMLASRPRVYVNGKLELDVDSLCIFDRCRSGNLVMGQFFSLNAFRDGAFSELKVVMREREDAEKRVLFNSFAEPESQMEHILQKFLHGPIEFMNSELASLRVDLVANTNLLRTMSSNDGVTSDSKDFHHDEQEMDDFDAAFREVIPIDAANDTLATGQRRKRKRCITQQIRNQEAAFRGDTFVTDTPIVLADPGFETMKEFWLFYAAVGNGVDHPFLQLEQTYGNAWRNDADGNAKTVFWSTRKPIWKLLCFYIEHRQMNLDDALNEVDRTWVSAKPVNKGKKKNIKDVARLCKQKLEELAGNAKTYMDTETDFDLILPIRSTNT